MKAIPLIVRWLLKLSRKIVSVEDERDNNYSSVERMNGKDETKVISLGEHSVL